jgi:hypothetical protein
MDYCEKENWHEAANLFPVMEQEDLDSLAADIKLNGLNNPITMLNGKVLDGRNRALACKVTGVIPAVSEYQGESPVRWVFSQNAKRRSLNKSQIALIVVQCGELMEKLSAEAKARQCAGVVAQLPQGRTRDTIGRTFGVSGRYLQRAKSVLKMKPEIVEMVRTGAISLTAAERRTEWDDDFFAIVNGPIGLQTSAEQFLKWMLPYEDALSGYERKKLELQGKRSKLSELEYAWAHVRATVYRAATKTSLLESEQMKMEDRNRANLESATRW